jgi:nucleotide-binding universal stress UspA family protein
MFKRVLVASDLSAASDVVIGCVKVFHSLGVEEVILFHALGIKHLDSLKYVLQEYVEPRLIHQKTVLESYGFKTVLEIAPGIPSEELKRVSKEKDVSLIIMGSHGQSAATHLLFRIGGIATEVLHSHEKPLLLVRTKIAVKDGEKCIEASCADLKKRILYLTDFSDTAHRAFSYVETLVECGCKNVTLMHVQDKSKIGKHLGGNLEEFNAIDTDRLELLRDKLIRKGAHDIAIKIPYGIPIEEILSESKNGYSLIVMGSQGRGFYHELFIGSVSHNVSRYADISVLLIPALR